MRKALKQVFFEAFACFTNHNCKFF